MDELNYLKELYRLVPDESNWRLRREVFGGYLFNRSTFRIVELSHLEFDIINKILQSDYQTMSSLVTTQETKLAITDLLTIVRQTMDIPADLDSTRPARLKE